MRDLVLHQPTGTLLNFAEDDFGGERQAAIIAAWQQGGHCATKGEFVCYAHRDHERPWLYLQQRGSVLVAAHWPDSGLAGNHQITHGVSDEHKRQVEYISRAGALVGFTVKPEVRLETGVRSDAVIYGSTAMGIEVQRSPITAQAAKARTTKARRAGVLPFWFSDSTRNPAWFGTVPGVRMNEQSWNTVPQARSVTVVSGTRVIVARRCRDIPDSRCPNRRYDCNRWHATHEPRLGTTVDELAELVPDGALVPITFKALSGKASIFIVSRVDKARYESMTGAPADLPPLRAKERRSHGGRQIDCSATAGRVVLPTCCGDRSPAVEVVVPACMLCPKSPTYWRHAASQVAA